MKEEVCTHRSLEIDALHATQGHMAKDQGWSGVRRGLKTEHGPEPLLLALFYFILFSLFYFVCGKK